MIVRACVLGVLAVSSALAPAPSQALHYEVKKLTFCGGKYSISGWFDVDDGVGFTRANLLFDGAGQFSNPAHYDFPGPSLNAANGQLTVFGTYSNSPDLTKRPFIRLRFLEAFTADTKSNSIWYATVGYCNNSRCSDVWTDASQPQFLPQLQGNLIRAAAQTPDFTPPPNCDDPGS